MPVLLASLVDVMAARVLVVNDTLVRMSPLAPISARFDLARHGDGGFVGTGRFSIQRAKQVSRALRVTPAEASAFLSALASAELEEGPYHPRIDHTDDFPFLAVALMLPERRDRDDIVETVTFASESQGEFHAPWSVRVGGGDYAAAGDGIGRAVHALVSPRQQTLVRMMASAKRVSGRRRRSDVART